MSPAPIDITAFENCVQDWFVQSTGLLTIWRQQGQPQPLLPYAGLHVISGPTTLAPQTERRRTTDLSHPKGREIEIEYCVPCRFVVSCQIYGDATFDDHGLMSQALMALTSATQQTKFSENNIAVERYSGIRCIGAVINDEYQARVNMDVTFAASLSVVDYVGYIESVEGVSNSLQIELIV
jgi:hypothetical protein